MLFQVVPRPEGTRWPTFVETKECPAVCVEVLNCEEAETKICPADYIELSNYEAETKECPASCESLDFEDFAISSGNETRGNAVADSFEAEFKECPAVYVESPNFDTETEECPVIYFESSNISNESSETFGIRKTETSRSPSRYSRVYSNHFNY